MFSAWEAAPCVVSEAWLFPGMAFLHPPKRAFRFPTQHRPRILVLSTANLMYLSFLLLPPAISTGRTLADQARRNRRNLTSFPPSQPSVLPSPQLHLRQIGDWIRRDLKPLICNTPRGLWNKAGPYCDLLYGPDHPYSLDATRTTGSIKSSLLLCNLRKGTQESENSAEIELSGGTTGSHHGR